MSISSSHKPTRTKPRGRFHADQLPFLSCLVATTMRLLHRSCRFTILGQEHIDHFVNQGKSTICTSWHFAFPAVIYHLRDRNGMVMVSRSRDGEWIARVLSHLGYQTARGSPNKGGGMALRQLIAHIEKGYASGFIADGSQGPALVAQKGILVLAAHTQTPVIPISMAASPCWRFRSWDRTVLAKPFSKIAIAFGPPIHVSRSAGPEEIEEARTHLQNSLNQLTGKCEEALSRMLT
jgi:lysophospholipid acyltransferase (LPLAT)-like uncharacterized protein